MTRRRFGQIVGGAFAANVAAGCGRATADVARTVLSARPSATGTTAPAGTFSLRLGDGRDGILHVPGGSADGSLPLIVLCHGAGGSGEEFFQYLGESIESWRAAVLATDARGSTWDAVLGQQRTLTDLLTGQRQFVGFGPDVTFLDRALERVFSSVAVDPARIAIAGFSDGATYALSLGVMNGDLFRRIVAFSPGFIIDGEPRGRPDIFVSHGRADGILPIERASRRIVPALRQRGHAVTYREFDSGHHVPGNIAREGVTWAIAVDR